MRDVKAHRFVVVAIGGLWQVSHQNFPVLNRLFEKTRKNKRWIIGGVITGVVCALLYLALAAFFVVFFMAAGHGTGYELLYYLGWPATIICDSIYFEQRGIVDRMFKLGAIQWLVNGFVLHAVWRKVFARRSTSREVVHSLSVPRVFSPVPPSDDIVNVGAGLVALQERIRGQMRGATRLSAIKALFGEPDEIEKNNGEERWVYYNLDVTYIVGFAQRGETVQIFAGPKDKLKGD